MEENHIYLSQLPWSVQLILRLRPDLNHLFFNGNKIDTKSVDHYIGWLLTSGIKEYTIIQQDQTLQHYLLKPASYEGISRLHYVIYLARLDVQQAYPLPLRKNEFIAWFYRHAVLEHQLWHWLSEDEQTWLTQQSYWEDLREREQTAMIEDCTVEPVSHLNQAPAYGVNLMGYVFGQLGIGEDLRMAGRACRAVGLPFALFNFKPGDDIPQNDMSMATYVTDSLPYNINIFCMTALEHGRFYVEKGKKPLAKRYNIGYWPWELSQWPVEWQDLTQLVDEVWVSTRHTYDALAPISPVPVLIMPMAVTLGDISTKTRQNFNLPNDTTLFCFSFDLNSSMYRKNPQACVEAFLQAFPDTEQKVGLVIKAHTPKKRNEHWEKLKAVADTDPRLYIIEETLSRPDLLALYQNCDCFLSLHRAEGFGRGIAEALLLDLHVIATAYSGNLDFCEAQTVDLVDYSLIPVGDDQYPYGNGQVWAEPDIHHAAQLMQQFVNGRQQLNKKVDKQQFAPAMIGQRYKQRLDWIKTHKLK
ncbi:MAG TPA: glycosyltransferase family 1 protein, partial [Thiothrix sp.]|nr:glycosyltransferase family 1 protein [Thiothrix sp.]